LVSDVSGDFLGTGDKKVIHVPGVLAEGEELAAVESDFIALFIENTSLPHASIGKGVFAKVDLPADEIVCEYRGMAVKHEARLKIASDKFMQATGPRGEDIFLLGDCICALINDSARITVKDGTGRFVVPYSDDELTAFEKSPYLDSIPVHPGFSYNVKYDRGNGTGKVFVKTLVNISAGSELFAAYGRWVLLAVL